MIVKTFARGIGAGRGPVDYCISTFVAVVDPITKKKTGEIKERTPPPVIMRGDPSETVKLIDSSQNIWKYTSGVIAFADTDAPTLEEQNAVIDSFEEMAFAGLEKDQYLSLWVKHEHEGNVELHFVTPRTELATGKALNIAPPGHEKTFDVWRDSLNYSKNWASPREPERKKLVKRDDDQLKNDAARLRAGLPLGDPKQLLTDHLLARDVKNRADVVRELRSLDLEITRTGVDYLSVRLEPGAKPIRLKGPLYESTFQADTAKPTLRYRNTADDAKRAKSASTELARIVEARSLHNRKRYPYPVDITPNQRLQRTYERAKSSVIASAFSAHEAASTRDAAFERASAELERCIEHQRSSTTAATQRASEEAERAIEEVERTTRGTSDIVERCIEQQRSSTTAAQRASEEVEHQRSSTTASTQRASEEAERIVERASEEFERTTTRIVVRAIEKAERTTTRETSDIVGRAIKEFERCIKQQQQRSSRTTERAIENAEREIRDTTDILERASWRVERASKGAKRCIEQHQQRSAGFTNEGFKSAIDVAIRIFDELKRKIEQFLTPSLPVPVLLTTHEPPQAEPVVPAAPSFSPPAPSTQNWPALRSYLIETRRFSADLVDELHEAGYVYADQFANAVFVLDSSRGVALQSTVDDSFYYLRVEKGAFTLLGSEQVAFTESCIDAISFRELGYEGEIVSTCGLSAASVRELADQYRKIGYKIVAAYDDDAMSDAIGADLHIVPEGATTWNAELVLKDSHDVNDEAAAEPERPEREPETQQIIRKRPGY